MLDSASTLQEISKSDLLFLLVALQADYLNRTQFEQAHATLLQHQDRPLADWLVHRGWLSITGRQEVARLVERKLAKHTGDVAAALKELSGESIRETLAASDSVHAQAPGPRARLRVWKQQLKKQGVANLAAIAIVTLTVGLAAGMALFPTDRPARNADPPPPAAEAAPDPAAEAVANSVRQAAVYSSALENFHQAFQRLGQTASALEARHNANTKGFEWYYLAHLGRYARLDLRAHYLQVLGLAFSPDNRHLASAGSDNAVKIWDAVTGEFLRALPVTPATFNPRKPSSAAQVNSLAYDPTGRRLAVACGDGMVRVWDSASGNLVQSFPAHASARSVVYSPDGSFLASAGSDGIKIWDAATGKAVRPLQAEDDDISALAYSPDGKLLASGGDDKNESLVKIWDAESGQCLHRLAGHTALIRAIAFSPDGQILASAAEDGSVNLWHVDEPEPIRSLRSKNGDGALALKAHGLPATGVAFAPDPPLRLVSAGGDDSVRFWGVGIPDVPELFRLQGGTFTCVRFSGDGARLAAGTSDGRVLIWEKDYPGPELLLERDAQAVVDRLFGPFDDREGVTKEIEHDLTLREGVRKEALARVPRHQEHLARNFDPQSLNNESWVVASLPEKEGSAYRRALRQAQEASRLQPKDGLILNTLGVAYYRVGKYSEALETLTRSDAINKERSPRPGVSIPADLVFIVMSHYQLGHLDQARTLIKQLDQSMAQGPWYQNPGSQNEAQRLVGEAQELVKGSPKPAAHK